MSYKKTEAPIARELKHAKALIKDPKDWIQGTFAMDINYCPVGARASTAVRFCAVGAIRHTTESALSVSYLSARFYLDMAANMMGISTVPEFNDSHTHEEVMELYDIAIAWAQGEFDANT